MSDRQMMNRQDKKYADFHIERAKEGAITFVTLIIVFFLNILMQEWFDTQTLIPMIFVMGVFVISMLTKGYFWGILSSLISVLAFNYAFSFPYYAFDLISPECVFSAGVMLAVAITTGALTTKLKEQEKIKADTEKERMRANLLRAVSHDLRTPLTTIYGSCSTIIDHYDVLSAEQKLKLLGEISQDSKWLIRMVENLLLVTRMDSEDGVKIGKLPVVLEELIDIVLVAFRKRCPNQKVQADIPEDFYVIPMDAMMIEQVLLNLLENAVYHAKGMENLSLRVDIDGKNAVFRVIDDGCGISEEKRTKLFTGQLLEKNIPADGKRSNMGIGLSACAAIVKAHDSQLFVKHRNPGAEFYFSLKMEEEDEQQV